MVAVVFFSPFFLAFLLVSSLCGDTMEAERGRYDGWNKPGGRPREDKDGGALCRAPCLKGTCEAWGGLGW